MSRGSLVPACLRDMPNSRQMRGSRKAFTSTRTVRQYLVGPGFVACDSTFHSHPTTYPYTSTRSAGPNVIQQHQQRQQHHARVPRMRGAAVRAGGEPHLHAARGECTSVQSAMALHETQITQLLGNLTADDAGCRNVGRRPPLAPLSVHASSCRPPVVPVQELAAFFCAQQKVYEAIEVVAQGGTTITLTSTLSPCNSYRRNFLDTIENCNLFCPAVRCARRPSTLSAELNPKMVEQL